MMLRVLPLALMVGLAGCVSDGGASSLSGTAPVAASPDRAALVGSWSGQLSGGSSVAVTIPASGTPTYLFQGSDVPVTDARMDGRSLVLTVGSGGGSVTLTPRGRTLAYSYSFQGSHAAALLART